MQHALARRYAFAGDAVNGFESNACPLVHLMVSSVRCMRLLVYEGCNMLLDSLHSDVMALIGMMIAACGATMLPVQAGQCNPALTVQSRLVKHAMDIVAFSTCRHY